MTTLTIIPNWKNKTARFKGTVAAGEHVAVTIQNDNGEGGKVITDASTLRLRVIGFDGRTLAIFPEPVPEGETPEEWDGDLSPLRCTLNLNTVQMLKAVPPAADVPLLFVLDDYENKTLYFKEQFSVEHWPRLRGEEEPTDLDNYKDIIAEFDARLADAEKNVAIAAENVQIAADAARGARAAAETAATRADAAVGDAQNGAIAAKNFAAAAQTAAESINSPDATLTQEGVAADAKVVGDAVRAEKQRAESAESSLGGRIDVEAQARLLLAATVQTNAATIATHTSSLVSLSSRVGENESAIADRYTKIEVDAKIGGFVDGAEYDSTAKKILLKHDTMTVAEIDATDFIKDGMVSSVEIEDGNLVITFNTDAGLKPIEIPLTDIFNPANYYDKTAADGKFVEKETGKGLSSNDYTDAEKNRITTLEGRGYLMRDENGVYAVFPN